MATAVTLLSPLALVAAPAAARPVPGTGTGAGPAAATSAGTATRVADEADRVEAAAVPLDQLTVTSTQVAFGLQRPTAIFSPDDGSGRILITEKGGRIRVYHPSTGLATDPLLDISSKVDTSGNERGLLGIVTPRNFAQTRTLYVTYTALPDGRLTLSRFTLDSADQTPIPASGEQVILTQPHSEYSNHNGGHLAFGSDGYLYWSMGDGGGSDDVLNSGQNLGTLLGKILRLDVSRSCGTQPYCVPADNPFVNQTGARPEIWAYGLRNPWKFSFDPADGSLWIADVGQGTYEEIDHLRADQAGANLGWSCREGPQVFNPDRCQDGATYVEPIYHYRTSEAGCAVIGGYVYRGQQYADIAAGTYLATDYCSGTAFVVRPPATPGGAYQTRALTELTIQPTSLGLDADGEIYLVNDLPGQLHKISFGSTAPPATCQVAYRVETQWGSGYIATVTVTNTGTQPIDGWTVDWAWAGSQQVTNVWSAAITQTGAAVTARNLDWNRQIAPGGSVSFGFQGSYQGTNPAPTSFTLNGSACG